MNTSNTDKDKQTREKEYNTETAAIWGAFLYEGLMMAEHKLGGGITLLDHYKGGGYIELVTELCECLLRVWKVAIQQKDFMNDHPGVFEYEVISEMGHYLGNHIAQHDGALPSKEELQAAITHSVLTFFS